MKAKPYAPLQLTAKRPPTEDEKLEAVREVIAARLGIPVNAIPDTPEVNADLRAIAAMIEETGRPAPVTEYRDRPANPER